MNHPNILHLLYEEGLWREGWVYYISLISYSFNLRLTVILAVYFFGPRWGAGGGRFLCKYPVVKYIEGTRQRGSTIAGTTVIIIIIITIKALGSYVYIYILAIKFYLLRPRFARYTNRTGGERPRKRNKKKKKNDINKYPIPGGY